VGTLVLTATLVALLTGAALAVGVRRDLGLPTRIAVYAVAYNALVVLVKFVLGPKGLWEVNQDTDLETLFPLDDKVGATLAATVVFGLYAATLWIVYRLCRRRLEQLPSDPVERRRMSRKLLIPLIVGGLLFAGTGGIAVLLIPLVFASGGLEYMAFVFSSSVSLLVALALAGATALAALAFRGTAERAALVGDAAVLASFFWLGLAFLALYHAVWVVYLLVLTAIWPLKVVVPK
jgi:hypothetical protein